MTTAAEQLLEEVFNYSLDDLVQELADTEYLIVNKTDVSKEKELDYLYAKQNAIEQRLFKQEKMIEWVPIYFEKADRVCAVRRVYSYQRYLRDLRYPEPSPVLTAKIYYYKFFVNYYKDNIESPRPPTSPIQVPSLLQKN